MSLRKDSRNNSFQRGRSTTQVKDQAPMVRDHTAKSVLQYNLAVMTKQVMTLQMMMMSLIMAVIATVVVLLITKIMRRMVNWIKTWKRKMKGCLMKMQC